MAQLISKDRLNLALNDFTERNSLIGELILTDKADPHRFYKLILAFWLGSHSILTRLQNENDIKDLFHQSERHILNGYYCILTLEKSLSLIQDNSSSVYNKLKHYQHTLFECFNANFDLLIEKPNQLFYLFKSIIQTTEISNSDSNELSWGKWLASLTQYVPYQSDDNEQAYQSLLDTTKNECLLDLQRELDYEHLKHNSFFPKESPLHINDVVNLSGMDTENLFIQVNKFITACSYRFPFYSGSSFINNEFHVQNILIRADDGIILHGLKVKKINSTSKNVVLALVGHFPNEDNYISSQAIEFCKLFDAETVFINHRNYSQRSPKLAASIDRIALDIVCFVNHFKQQNREICLYGMCGGASHMILAARLLSSNTKFKLIIDRFSRKYIHFIEAKTIKRLAQYETKPADQPTYLIDIVFKSPLVNLLFPLYLTYMSLAKSLSKLTNTDCDFGDLIKTIPEEDVLILQAKSKKQEGQAEPKYTDLIVHPQNDIRRSVKERRQQNKSILKDLSRICRDLYNSFPEEHNMRVLFDALSDYFGDCLKLIQNEKLFANDLTTAIVTDLHSRHLMYLTTRNKMPMAQFVGGFFKQEYKDWRSTLNEFNIYSTEQILEIANKMYEKNPKNLILAESLNQFLQILSGNKDVIYHAVNRLYNTEAKDISVLLHKLVNSDLFNQLLYKTYLPSIE